MAQFIYTMNRVGKVIPPKRVILRDISLSFFPGAKIGVLGLNGSGKSTLLKIMAGVDKEFEGEARPQPGIKIGYLEQEPKLDEKKDVRGNVLEGVAETQSLIDRFNAVSDKFADPDLSIHLATGEWIAKTPLTRATAGTWNARWKWLAMRCAYRPGTQMSAKSPAANAVASRCVVCSCRSPTCSCWTNPPITWTLNQWRGSNTFWKPIPAL